VSTNDEQVGFGTTACKNEAWLVDWICQMSTNDLQSSVPEQPQPVAHSKHQGRIAAL